MLALALRAGGKCLCPRCYIQAKQVSAAGTKIDDRRRAKKRVDNPQLQDDIKRAREYVFQGHSITSKRVKNLLDDRSLNPIQNAFSERLSQFGLNCYELFAPDLMHEFELGVWRGTFNHLMRLLAAQSPGTLVEFDRRMRLMPTFGRDRIRRFWNDVSSRKKLAARDYEAFLQTIMPAYEGLLPVRDDETIADMLFELANWHALAKLRLHTVLTLDTLDAATKYMYAAVREFAKETCSNYDSRELPKEAEARARRENKKTSKKHPIKINDDTLAKAAGKATPKSVPYNVINTYKYHCLGDYVEAIRRLGPADNFTTQVGELEHRHAKRYFTRTNKVSYVFQIAQKQRRRAILEGIRRSDRSFVPRSDLKLMKANAKKELAERLDRGIKDATDRRQGDTDPPTLPQVHHEVSHSQRDSMNLYRLADEYRDDPAAVDFVSELREYILRTLLQTDHSDFSDAQHLGLDIYKDNLFRHKVMRVNYTTYDMRRGQDSINARTHPDIMLLADGPDADDHPFWYARVLDIFHVDVRYFGPGSTRATQKWQRIEVAWVRWFKHDKDYLCGFTHRRLPRVRFMDPATDAERPFGFINPDDIIRASYLMPGFALGRTDEYLGPSKLARRMRFDSDNDDDWAAYYVCMWIDRDMYMRYHGGGIGHRGVGVSLDASRNQGVRIPRKKRKQPRAPTTPKGKARNESPDSSDSPSILGSGTESDHGGVAMDFDSDSDPDMEEAGGDQAHDDSDLEPSLSGSSSADNSDGDDAGDGDSRREDPQAADRDEDAYDDPVYAAEGYAEL